MFTFRPSKVFIGYLILSSRLTSNTSYPSTPLSTVGKTWPCLLAGLDLPQTSVTSNSKLARSRRNAANALRPRASWSRRNGTRASKLSMSTTAMTVAPATPLPPAVSPSCHRTTASKTMSSLHTPNASLRARASRNAPT